MFCNTQIKKVFKSVIIIEHCQTRLHTNSLLKVIEVVVMSDEVMSDDEVG